MDGSIGLSAKERKRLLQAYRAGNGRSSRRAHVILLLAGHWTWEQIRAVLFCSNDLISRTLRRWTDGRVDGVLSEIPGEESQTIPTWLRTVVRWVEQFTPQDFGFFRTRWSCEVLAELLAWETGVRHSAETIRRGLHAMGFVWRRPRPVVGPTDPNHHVKLRRIQQLLTTLPDDEVAVFEDEVDVHLNPKIGSMWMLRGQQAQIETPGNNQKCHVAGSLAWGTGTLFVSPPEARRNADLFVAHLDDLRRRLRSCKRIHVICDNARFHNCRKVWDYLRRWGHRIVLHYLPKYAPETNPIERVWWHLHETITRNHRCQTLEELVQHAFDWFKANNNHFLDMRNTFAKAA